MIFISCRGGMLPDLIPFGGNGYRCLTQIGRWSGRFELVSDPFVRVVCLGDSSRLYRGILVS